VKEILPENTSGENESPISQNDLSAIHLPSSRSGNHSHTILNIDKHISLCHFIFIYGSLIDSFTQYYKFH
jgi:hypothetical protein